MHSCECGYDLKTERLLRAAAQRIQQLESTLRDMRRALGARPGRTNRSDLHTRGPWWRPRAPAAHRNWGEFRKKGAAKGGGLRSVHGLLLPTVGCHA